MAWRTVYRLEWRILRRDRAALLVLGVFAAFLLVAALAGGRAASTLEAGIRAERQTETDAAEAHTVALESLAGSDKAFSARDPRDPVWMGQDGAAHTAVLPPAPLAPIALGQRDLQPQAVRVTTGVRLTAQRESRTAMSGPTRQMTGPFDPAFLFVMLFPLVVIALSYELLSGERERGTLAMLLSQPVTQASLVLGKAGARATALCIVTVAFAVLGLGVGGADLGSGAAWLHVGLYVAVLVAWALFWFAAAVAVNAWSTGSDRNALMLVGLWLALVVIVPGLVSVGVDTFAPAPSSSELEHEIREAAEDIERELVGLEGRHDVDPRTQGFSKKKVAVEQELLEKSAPLLQEHRRLQAEREAVVGALRFTSPALVVQLALEDIAGSGTARHSRFAEQVAAFHGTYRGYFATKIQAGAPFAPSDVARIPKMEFQEEPASALVGRVLSGLALLALLIALLLGCAWPGLRKIGRLTR
jgi:ABC-2 type transport system permease protein